MQATLRSPAHEPRHDASIGTWVFTRKSSKLRSNLPAPESLFRLTVRCAQCRKDVGPLLRDALAENLIGLSQRVKTIVTGQTLCTFEATVRSVRDSRCQVVALIARLQVLGVRDVWWESVLDQ